MQLEYRLSVKDYQEATQAHLKLQLWLYFFFWFFIILGLFFLIIPFISEARLDLFIVCYFVFFAIIFFNPYFSNSLRNYFFSRTWKGFHNFHHPITIEVDEEQLKLQTINCESTIRWQLYIKAIETKNLFMIYQVKELFNIIPKRAFNSDEQIDEFRDLLQTKIVKFQKV